MNPDLELIESDDEAQTLTIRNKETGEVFTADWSDIKEGRFLIDADGKEVTFDAKQGATGEGGSLTGEDESGRTVNVGLTRQDDVTQVGVNYVSLTR